MQEATVVGVSEILTNVDTFGELVKATWNLMTSNPLLMLFLCGSLLSLGFAFYRKAKRAVRG